MCEMGQRERGIVVFTYTKGVKRCNEGCPLLNKHSVRVFTYTEWIIALNVLYRLKVLEYVYSMLT